MKIKLDRKKVIPVSFILLSLTSAVYISEETVNYLRFWPALSRLEAQISKVVVAGGPNPNQTTLSVHFTVSNPSDYDGFEVWESSVILYFFVSDHPNVTLFTNQPLGVHLVIRTPLGANARLANDQVIPLSTENSTALWDFRTKNPGVLAHVVLNVDIVTFLNSVIGHTHLIDENDFPLSSN